MDRYRWALWAPLSGIASAALFVIAFAVAGDPGDSSREVAEFYADSGNRAQVQTFWFLIAAAALLLIWFVWSLRARLLAAEGGIGGLSPLVFGTGVVSAALWFVAASLFAAPAFGYEAADFDAKAAQLVSDAGYGPFVGAQMIFAFTIVATALVTFRLRIFPIWFGWASLVVGLVLLFAIAFYPFFLFLAWIAAASGLMLWGSWGERRGVRSSAAA